MEGQTFQAEGAAGTKALRRELRGLDGCSVAGKWASGGRGQRKPDHAGSRGHGKELGSLPPTESISYSRHQSLRRLRVRPEVPLSGYQDQLRQ